MVTRRAESSALAGRLIAVDTENFDTLSCCGIKNLMHPGRQEKRCWLQKNAKFGLRARVVLGTNGQPNGYIEYVPGEFAWRAVNATGYLFIHCIWTYARQNQRKGVGSIMVGAVLDEARKAGMHGVAVVVREGPWMADRRLFLANGFNVADSAPPDYELLVSKFDSSSADPAFKKDFARKLSRYKHGLTIIRSSQCPHICKFADEIIETAKNEYHLEPTIVRLKSWRDAQQAPTAYAVFAVIHNGVLLADHPISRTRFRNIMSKLSEVAAKPAMR